MASTNRNGTKYTQPTQSRGPIALGGHTLYNVPPGQGVVQYFLGCFDAVGIRHHWFSFGTTTADAPQTTDSDGVHVTLPYATSTIVILGSI